MKGKHKKDWILMHTWINTKQKNIFSKILRHLLSYSVNKQTAQKKIMHKINAVTFEQRCNDNEPVSVWISTII